MGYYFNQSQNCTLVNSQSINSTSHEIYFYDSRDNDIVDSTVTNNVSGNDVYSSTSSWNYLVNTSVNESNFGDDTTSNISLQWYLDLFVQDNETIPVAGASIWLNDTFNNNYTSSTAAMQGQGSTSQNSFLPRLQGHSIIITRGT